MQLLETALVIEGHVKKLSFPFADSLFHRVLSEWTTVTIPYLRIVHWKYVPLYVTRAVVLLVAWLPVLFCLSLLIEPRGSPEGPLIVAGMLGVLALLVTWLVYGRLLIPRNRVLFRARTGG